MQLHSTCSSLLRLWNSTCQNLSAIFRQKTKRTLYNLLSEIVLTVALPIDVNDVLLTLGNIYICNMCYWVCLNTVKVDNEGLKKTGFPSYIPVVPGQAGGGSFQKEKNYIAKKEFAYRMCARRPTSAMPKSFLCLCSPSAVPWW